MDFDLKPKILDVTVEEKSIFKCVIRKKRYFLQN